MGDEGTSRLAAALPGLVAAVGPGQVLLDPALTAGYGRDWSGRWQATPLAVVRPGSTAEVAQVVRLCTQAGVAVVPQGGNTGLVGGSVPGSDGSAVVVSTVRLTTLGPAQPDGRGGATVTVGAGVTLAALHAHAARVGYAYGVDLAARDTATVGGTVATNAGGIRVCAYGDTRAQVVGVEAVLPDGSVLDRLDPPAKDSSGFDVTGLLVGSEGILGVLTAVRVRLHPTPGPSLVVLVGCPDVAAAQVLVAQPDLRAAELVSHDGMLLVAGVLGRRLPLAAAWPWYLLLEVGDVPDLPDDADAVVDPRLWEWRERQTEAVAVRAAQIGAVVHKLDVAVPADRLPDLVAGLPGCTAGAEVVVFGHVAEANLHVNLLVRAGDAVPPGGAPAADTAATAAPDRAVLELVAALGGTIAAEHGVGRAKASLLGLTRSPAELAAMRAVKRALDPAGLLNPGVLLE